MLPMLSELKIRRKQLGITQSELSRHTGVSQSLIAKIESETVIPGYENAKRLFDYLDSLEEKNQLSAFDLMNNQVITIEADASLKKAVRLMEQHSVSQLPVLKNGTVVGTIHEKDLLLQIGKSKTPEQLAQANVEIAMTEALPQITKTTPFRVVSALMSHHDAVLVTEKGKIHGILTKSDLLKLILNQRRKLIHF